MVRSAGGWTLAGALPELERERPQSITSMIERKLGLLDADDVELLRVASIQGHDFDSATVADVARIDPAVGRDAFGHWREFIP